MGTVRFLLALCVVATHDRGGSILGVPLFSAITAVQCFYVISGFLITMVLNERKEYRSVLNFYVSRYLRLWPAYIVIAILSLVLFNHDRMVNLLPTVSNWPGVAFIAFSNLTLFFQDWLLFLRFDHGHLVLTAAFSAWPGPQANWFLLAPQCWTLGVEMTFYAVAPFVCRRWWLVAGLFAAGVAVRLFVATFHPPLDPWIYRFAPSEMTMFAAGGLAYFAGRSICLRYPLLTKIACAVAIAAIATIVFGRAFVQPAIDLYFGWYYKPLMIMNLPVILLMVVSAAPLFYGTRRNSVDKMLGELSYPMYVSHILVVNLAARYVPAWLQAGNLFYVASVVVVSLILLFAITIPTDRLRKRFGARVPMVGRSPLSSVSGAH